MHQFTGCYGTMCIYAEFEIGTNFDMTRQYETWLRTKESLYSGAESSVSFAQMVAPDRADGKVWHDFLDVHICGPCPPGSPVMETEPGKATVVVSSSDASYQLASSGLDGLEVRDSNSLPNTDEVYGTGTDNGLESIDRSGIDELPDNGFAVGWPGHYWIVIDWDLLTPILGVSALAIAALRGFRVFIERTSCVAFFALELFPYEFWLEACSRMDPSGSTCRAWGIEVDLPAQL
ncbi:MAG: hypothetical protein IPJ88_15575 [Myxococcales bacterium]|nr:MAG: hypothetical protein IPJ88_15575 [Myxococcales bacterium]